MLQMNYNPEIHRRRSIRLKDYDYSGSGAYFVTICAYDRECIFGEVIDGRMMLNEAGKAVQDAWSGLSDRFQEIELDAAVIMPNHFHGIIFLAGALLAASDSNDHANLNGKNRKGAASSAPTLGNVFRVFKSLSARNINRILLRSARPVWQRNYYDHIIRSEDEMNKIREYIQTNPSMWPEDAENPRNKEL
jgi:putative transposase